MQKQDRETSTQPHLVWVYGGDLGQSLDAATWLKTTKELRKLGWKVTLIGTGEPGYHSIGGVEVFNIHRPDIYFVRQIVFHARLAACLLEHLKETDVILFHEMSTFWILPLRLVRRLLTGQKRPLFVMDTRTVPMEPEEKADLRTRLRWMYQNIMVRVSNRWTDGRLAITRRMAEAVKIPSKKLWGVWPSGVELGLFTSAQDDRQWPQDGEPIDLIYVGCLHYERNLLTLSKAVVRANQNGMAFRLTLVGDGTEREDLEAFASASNGQIVYIPPVPHEQVRNFLADSHIGVLPFPDELKFQVSSPIKLFEYMASGLPILATRIVCHTDVVSNGDYAFWAEGADEDALLESLELIWKSRDALQEKSVHAVQSANGWTWHASAVKLDTALKSGLPNGH